MKGPQILELSKLHVCDNCGSRHDVEALEEIKDLEERLDHPLGHPDCVMPSGECPVCGALCYPMKPEDLAVPRIELYRYRGYNGTFAEKRIPLWKCEFVGLNGTRRDSNPNSWYGCQDKQYPLREARDFAEFTGWPIYDLGHVEERDDPERH